MDIEYTIITKMEKNFNYYYTKLFKIEVIKASSNRLE